MSIVVLGIGNILLSDEGVGVRALELLRATWELPAGVSLIDGGTSAMELLDDLENVDLLIVLDAVRAGRVPGSLIHLTGDAVPVFFRTKLSPHQIGLADVLASLDLLGTPPRETVILGVEPLSLETGLELSGPVAACLPEMAHRVVDQLGARGVNLRPRSVVAAA
jgi:hydrogenase maturation protease